MEYVWNFRYVIVAVICGIVYSISEWSNVKGQVLQAIVAAKDLAKDKVLNSGQEQEEWVVKKLLLILPARVKVFCDEETLRNIVKYFYDKSMDLLDDGVINNSNSNTGENITDNTLYNRREITTDNIIEDTGDNAKENILDNTLENAEEVATENTIYNKVETASDNIIDNTTVDTNVKRKQ